jgi:hypothetical protein
MDKTIHDSFINRNAPFDDTFITLYNGDFIGITELRDCLIGIVNHLEIYFPENVIYRYDDWHMHDGFITGRKVWDYDRIKKHLKDNESLKKSMQGDFDVYWAYYPDSLEFLFRYYLNDDNTDEGLFDISAKAVDIHEITKYTAIRNLGLKKEEKTYEYFKRIDAS